MNRPFRGVLFLSAIALFLYPASSLSIPLTFQLLGPNPIKGFTDNAISVLTSDGQHLWAGTGGGVTRSIGNPTLSENWVTYTRDHGLCGNSISAIAVGPDGMAWTASAGDTVIGQDELPYGTGLSYSYLPYEEFDCYGQPGDTPVQNVTYDIAINGDTLWTASWGGGCLSPGPYTGLWRSIDKGQMWDKVVLQSGVVDPGDPKGHVAFSVIAWDSWVWVGTAGGIYKSTDAGSTWVIYNYSNSDLSGDFVVALAAQYLEDDFIIWAGTKPTAPGQITAISMSPDSGKTWRAFLGNSIGEGAWNFAFQDTTVWAATSQGLFRTDNFGLNWDQFTASQGLPSSEVYSVTVLHDTVYAGTLDGLAYTPDDGQTWGFLRFSAPTGFLDQVSTYAYPNPFSPSREELGVKIRYSLHSEAVVTIKIYDWSLHLVKTIAAGRVTPEENGQELLEFWDGRNDDGQIVANGVYFYTIETDRGGEAFGKIVVLD
jgi:ligand-binding sensor domain-containing protein